jgi:hypothetical protein
MTTAAPSAVEPVHLGPTWERDPEHPSGWRLPKLTLGWSILRWQATRLQHADGRPWRYSPEQLRLFLWWYSITSSLRFEFRDGVIQRIKGWGKDPFAATLCGTEFVGPCRPDPSGRTVTDPWGNEHPAGIEHPEAWVQLAAVSKDQNRNTMTLFPGLFTKQAIEEYSINLGKEIIYAHKGARRIEAVTSSPRALEGGRPTFTLRNETHHWLRNNDGHEMDAVIDRNAAKSADGASRALSITNAYEPGEDSVAERAREAHDNIAAGRYVDVGLFYDSLEAPPDAPLTAEAAPAVVSAVRGDSTWLDVDRIVAGILDPRNPPSRSRRFWYNQIVASEDAWVSPQEFDRNADPDRVVELGAQITLGFDGSKSDDHSALIGSLIDSDYTFEIKTWVPDDHTNEVDRADIDRTVHEAFEMYDVVGFYSDLHPWESYVDAWAEEFGDDLCAKASTRHAIAWDMRGRTAEFTAAAESLHGSITDENGTWRHCGSKAMRQHFVNARRSPNKWGISVRKEHRESPRKIDSVPAAILARKARMDYLALPERRQRKLKRSGKAAFY